MDGKQREEANPKHQDNAPPVPLFRSGSVLDCTVAGVVMALITFIVLKTRLLIYTKG